MGKPGTANLLNERMSSTHVLDAIQIMTTVTISFTPASSTLIRSSTTTTITNLKHAVLPLNYARATQKGSIQKGKGPSTRNRIGGVIARQSLFTQVVGGTAVVGAVLAALTAIATACSGSCKEFIT
eukprot:gnl/MRDRNA2_/MRDRNA2_78128_c0_seq2.p1 gnl/MRDRNA2_/MRDRNA2_78128_c0~~gnl/MRDRNA2_/MRDRNA2_78128_c0_seq2.p1  ORF type:complete len:126 (-),score=9.62 gnl/MRDRNA2_/MRDRNA2_78128_c0_seq2:383-760(-)